MLEAEARSIVGAGIVLGAGLGGFLDGIWLHQILQWHNMLSGWTPPDTLVDAKVNMFWDGVFHMGVWLLTVLGLAMLWRGLRRGVAPRSGQTLIGAMLCGWGLFNVVEGTIDHLVLGIHHVQEYASDHLPADLAFLAFGLLLIFIGWLLIRSGSQAVPPD